MSACDYAAGPQKFARRNIDCQIYHPDLFDKDTTTIPTHSTVLYTAGFPCKAFSSLRAETRLLKDKEARQFYQVCEEMEHLAPKVMILENVLGIRKVLTKVLARLGQIGDYYISEHMIDPWWLGAPTSRQRIYFLLVSRDVLHDLPDKDLTARVEEVLEARAFSFSIGSNRHHVWEL